MEETRKIAIELCYDGTKFYGSAPQKNKPTVAGCLIEALIKSKVFVNDKLVFAGRTDKNVSAVGMVVSLEVQKKISQKVVQEINEEVVQEINKEIGEEANDTMITQSDINNSQSNLSLQNFESNINIPINKHMINYDAILNRFLPPTIRITGWCFVPDNFSARFNCNLRKYKYFFYKKQLDINLMQEGCKILKKATHFQNLSKKTKEIKSLDDDYFYRPIQTINIEETNDFDIFVLNIISISFIHNMIRKIFWALKQLGLGLITINELEKIARITDEEDVAVGTEIGEALLFCGAGFDIPLEWRKSKVDEKRIIHSIVQCEIGKTIYRNKK